MEIKTRYLEAKEFLKAVGNINTINADEALKGIDASDIYAVDRCNACVQMAQKINLILEQMLF